MEEFTFPCVPVEQCNAKTLPFPHFSSPSPWLVAGSVDTAVHEHDHRRSFSAVEPQAAACSDHYAVAGAAGYQHHGSARYAVEEDKMDMLWEDFNEEIAGAAAPPCPLTKGTPWTAAKDSWFPGDEDFVPAETRKHAVVRRKRMGLLTMLRLLKKLFLAHKSSATTSRKAPPI
ncbi:hypothetical protein PR202_ga03842 [Eleusine coracana subsp. coracana]|uniref:Uncharacterized protein n=1 Tax=Eleusine coracana subsp. coracana TaxID=191504 RepID=A0AAV5BPM6_ELECO|nr:hypothetical protein PR202_ga03842 [Eleusine coracana subsp. coracana]